MVSINFVTISFVILCFFYLVIIEAASKLQHSNVKTALSGKTKVNLQQAKSPTSKTSQRNGKMNYYNAPHMWPTTTTFYRPASMSSFHLRSPPIHSSSAFYPVHSYISPSSLVAPNTLRRTDDFSSSLTPLTKSLSSVMPVQSLSSPIMSIGNSQIPTLYDMSAFTGNVGLMEHPLINSNQNIWSASETVAATPKSKLSSFNSFNYNDDGDLFAGFLNQFLK